MYFELFLFKGVSKEVPPNGVQKRKAGKKTKTKKAGRQTANSNPMQPVTPRPHINKKPQWLKKVKIR